ncbi:MAG: amidohydrolase, partial [Eubacteriales bacterium]|nr:amidohydrolase [Eubacteriales bacterium]
NIMTLDTDKPYVQALVVVDGIIKYIGSKDIAMKFKGEKTKILDYGEATIYPGFMDAHTHGPMAGQRLAFQADLTAEHSMSAYVEKMAEYVKKNPDRKVIMGAGWSKYDEPTAAMLDAICPDKPMILRSIDGHSVWCNTAAIKYCSIDKNYVEQFGTARVHVDAEGNPSGLFVEEAASLIIDKFKVTKEEMKEGLLAWQEFAFSQGITAVAEAYLDMYPETPEAYAELVEEGKWKLRTYAYNINVNTVRTDPFKIGSVLREMADKYDSEYFKVLGQKMILDGVVEGHTAAMVDEYADQPGYHGVINLDNQKALEIVVESANEAGFPVHTHAIGDLASNMMSDAYKTVALKTGNFDARNALCHLQIVSPETIQKCGDYNIIAVVAPTWAPVLMPYFNDSIKYLGEKRAWEQYPIKAFEDAGATLCFHTDYPVNTIMSVPLSVYTAVKRARPLNDPDGGPKSVNNPDEAISALRALLAMTINVAYMCKQENHLGTLAIGKVANAAVYTKDFITCDYKEIMDAQLVATIVDGEEVYKA